MSCLLMGWDYFQIVLFSSNPPPPTCTPVDTINKPVGCRLMCFWDDDFSSIFHFGANES